jgi:hypothetical protein
MLFTSGFSDSEIVNYVNLTSAFIKAQREAYVKGAAPLSPSQQEAFKPFFEEAILKNTLFYQKQDGPVETPDFLRELNGKGIDFSLDRMTAITFMDVVVSVGELDPRVQFHELVHAVQYRKLGLKQFANKYFQGLLRTGKYEKIPLEVNARLLDEAYAKDPSAPFSVEADVQKWLNENKF